jgi:hypothetical protein
MHTLYSDMPKTTKWLSHFLTSTWLIHPSLISPFYYLLKSIFHLCCPGPSHVALLNCVPLGPTGRPCSLTRSSLVWDLGSPSFDTSDLPPSSSLLPPPLVPCPENPRSPTSASLPDHWLSPSLFTNENLLWAVPQCLPFMGDTENRFWGEHN